MQHKKILEAKRLAQEFIISVSEMEAVEAKIFELNGRKPRCNAPKFRGAVRRRSMDLTRALAEMRRP
jgi:hypothetical protein